MINGVSSPVTATNRRDIDPAPPVACLNIHIERIGGAAFRRTLSYDTVPWRTSEQPAGEFLEGKELFRSFVP